MARTPEELAQLKTTLIEMRSQGWSTPRIAEKLGLTRDQASGLINRLIRGYKSPGQYEAMKKKEAAAAEGIEFVPPTSGARPRPSQPVIVEPMPIVKTDLSFEPLPGKVNIWNVKPCQCRWVDEEGFFCGEVTGAPTKSYCPEHHARCFVPNERRSKRVSIKRPVDTKTLYDRNADDHAFRRSEDRDERQELWAVSGQL